ncbi:YjgN family protein [Roseateles sp.]|uniref:YjgN family protein n=1 Tax=Roseateles sp. TaxID=1971397 RepID=UPI002DFBFC6E|nr:YjgN family protein [Roseateles sp.]
MHEFAAAADAAPPSIAPAPATPPDPRVLEIRFTGSGSEYFRIWSVNLLLILVTLGLYLPFAKARRIRYFYANTLVDGQALAFHGDPWKMFRGFLLLVVLMGTYSAAGHFSPTAAFVAFLILCAVWPALWRASLQFRLGNTSWRGLRLRFEGSLRGAYLACLPSYLPAIALIGGALLMQAEGTAGPVFTPATALYASGALCMALFGPWSLALFKRYQHNGYRIAGQASRIRLSVAKLYLLSLKTIGVAVLPAVAAGAVVAFVMGAAHAMGLGKTVGLVVVTAGVLLGYLLFFAIVMPYGAARMQDLVWNGTRSEALTFHSALKFRSLFVLTLKNWLLTAFTLGLYRPFAAVATARLRLEAVRIDSSEDPADWVAAASAGHADATGDIAGDFFGIDMGL